MSATNLILRPAARADLSAIADIYNHYVAHSTCTFATEPETPAYWDAWLDEHTGPHPAIVAVDGPRLVGWGTLSRWNTRCAYRFSVEDSVYVEDALRGRGIGRDILAELIRLARSHGHHGILAQIADRQPASERLHRQLGFRCIGHIKEVGFKFDRWIDVSIWQCLLPQAHDEDHADDPPCTR